MSKKEEKKIRPEQEQKRPGKETKMKPAPESFPLDSPQKLKDKVALITGGDSGIGKATALLFAAHGADIAIAYLSETDDAGTTRDEVEKMGRQCLLVKGDLSREENCKKAVEKTIQKFSKLDILINNAALHWEKEKIEDITTEQLERTFYTNFFSYFWVTKYAMAHLKEGSTIVNTTSVTAYRGSKHLLDYAATKGAIVAWTRSLALQVVGISQSGVDAVDRSRVLLHTEDLQKLLLLPQRAHELALRLHDPRQARAQLLQPLQRVVELEQLLGLVQVGLHHLHLAQCLVAHAAAALLRDPVAGMVDDDVAHRARSDGQEMVAVDVLEQLGRGREPEVGLVDQRGGGQGLANRTAAPAVTGDLAQFSLHVGHQLGEVHLAPAQQAFQPLADLDLVIIRFHYHLAGPTPCR